MEVMDYENKYKEALGFIEKVYRCSNDPDEKKRIEEIFPELAGSESERIKTFLHHTFTAQYLCKDKLGKWHGEPVVNILAWLEKQGEHANFRDKIQIGDKVTRNRDGVLINLSKLNRVAKKDEKQGEQKSAEWTAKDEKTIVKMRDFFIRVLGDKPDFTEDKRYEEFIEFIDNRLKSLRGRFTWKPSKEQLEALEHFVRSIGENGYASPYDNNTKLLYSLLSDLKKLTE